MGGLCCRRHADRHDVDDGHDGHDVDSIADEVVSPCSPHLAPAPSWGRSFLEGNDLRRRANVDSRSIELEQ